MTFCFSVCIDCHRFFAMADTKPNNTAMGPDADIPTTTDKAAFGDHNEEMDDGDSIKASPNYVDPMEALGIENWREIEKKVVRRLDITLLPMLWVLYLSNYLDRTNIAYVVAALVEINPVLTISAVKHVSMVSTHISISAIKGTTLLWRC